MEAAMEAHVHTREQARSQRQLLHPAVKIKYKE